VAERSTKIPPNDDGPRAAQRESRPNAEVPAKVTDTTSVSRRADNRRSTRKTRPPLAPASVYAPLGRRRYWWYSYGCRTCNTFHFGRARELDGVTGVRRAGCGHKVQVMIARLYGAAS
jgi:hypothetical protein